MSLITNDIQTKLSKLLSEEGLVSRDVVESALSESAKNNQSLIAYLLENNIVDNEILIHAISHV